jgi:hypothetical protein
MMNIHQMSHDQLRTFYDLCKVMNERDGDEKRLGRIDTTSFSKRKLVAHIKELYERLKWLVLEYKVRALYQRLYVKDPDENHEHQFTVLRDLQAFYYSEIQKQKQKLQAMEASNTKVQLFVKSFDQDPRMDILHSTGRGHPFYNTLYDVYKFHTEFTDSYRCSGNGYPPEFTAALRNILTYQRRQSRKFSSAEYWKELEELDKLGMISCNNTHLTEDDYITPVMTVLSLIETSSDTDSLQSKIQKATDLVKEGVEDDDCFKELAVLLEFRKVLVNWTTPDQEPFFPYYMIVFMGMMIKKGVIV